VTSRLEGDPLGPAWRAEIRGTPTSPIDLGPLHREEPLSLAGAFPDTSHQVALASVERAEGNPLFLDQLLRNAGEDAKEALPASILSLVLARTDRLPVVDKQALAIAGHDVEARDALARYLSLPGVRTKTIAEFK